MFFAGQYSLPPPEKQESGQQRVDTRPPNRLNTPVIFSFEKGSVYATDI